MSAVLSAGGQCVAFAAGEPGTLKWAFKIGNSVHSSPAIGSDGTIYVGNLYAIYSDSYGLANSPWPMFHHDVQHTGRVSEIQEPEKTVIPLKFDETYEGIIKPYQFAYFSLQPEEGQSIVIDVETKEGLKSVFLDGKLGKLPIYTAGEYTTKDKTPTGHYQLIISPAQAGTYYFSLVGREVDKSGGKYAITARLTDKYLSDVSPRSAGNKGNAALCLKGVGFTEGMKVKLTGETNSDITAENITVISPTEMSARFNLAGAIVGKYGISVTWSDNTTLTFPAETFEIKAGTGSKFEAHFETPQTIRPGRKYTVWLEYSNIGDADMPAPLLTTDSNCSISLDKENITGDQVQILGIGNSIQDILGVGESRRMTQG